MSQDDQPVWLGLEDGAAKKFNKNYKTKKNFHEAGRAVARSVMQWLIDFLEMPYPCFSTRGGCSESCTWNRVREACGSRSGAAGKTA